MWIIVNFSSTWGIPKHKKITMLKLKTNDVVWNGMGKILVDLGDALHESMMMKDDDAFKDNGTKKIWGDWELEDQNWKRFLQTLIMFL